MIRMTPAEQETSDAALRPVRADARRNVEALLEAAKAVFASGRMDAPAKEITDLAGLGVGTLYRHFPRRGDLVLAVFQREIDACAGAAAPLAQRHGPSEALDHWLVLLTELIATKRGLASALHSGDPAFDNLPEYIWTRLTPALDSLLLPAQAAGFVRRNVDSRDILPAISRLCASTGEAGAASSARMVAIFMDGLHHVRE